MAKPDGRIRPGTWRSDRPGALHLHLLLVLVLLPGPAASQDVIPASFARRATVARLQGVLARTGVRGLLGESGFRGELLDRAASYRMAGQLELARTSALEGRISALEGALADPSLPAADRVRLKQTLGESRAALSRVPDYPIRYTGAVLQAGALLPVSYLLGRPQYIHVKATGYRREDSDGALGVWNGRAEATLVHAATDALFLGIGASAGGTEAEIEPFDGWTRVTGGGSRVFAAYAPDPHWTLAVSAERTWSRGSLALTRPDGSGGTRIDRPVRERQSVGTVWLRGRFGGEAGSDLPSWLTLEPGVSAWVLHTRHGETVDNLGQSATGVYGPTDVLAVVRGRLGAVVAPLRSRWSIAGQLGLDREIRSDMTELVPDGLGVELSASLVRRLGVARRVLLSLTHYRGTLDLRRATQLDVVAVFDAEPWMPGRQLQHEGVAVLEQQGARE